MTKCQGCGITLQYLDPKLPGFTPKEDSVLCQRCFRLRNYGNLMFSAKQEVNSIEVLSKVAKMDALVLWIVDLFDFETGIQESINRWLSDHDIIMVCTKRDLLPDSLGQEKLTRFIRSRLKEKQISVKGIVVIGDHGYDGSEEIVNAIKLYRHKRDVVVIGNTNAGKSTMLKTVFGIPALTISRYPGTTLDFIELVQPDYTIYDTPGFNRMNNAQILMKDADLKIVIPNKRIKPVTFQLNKDQTLSLGGLLRIDLLGCEEISCVCYFSERLLIHRSKTEKADQLWAEQYGKLLVPIIGEDYSIKKQHLPLIGDKFDIVILGLGWICLTGQIKDIIVSGNDQIDVLVRKAIV